MSELLRTNRNGDTNRNDDNSWNGETKSSKCFGPRCTFHDDVTCSKEWFILVHSCGGQERRMALGETLEDNEENTFIKQSWCYKITIIYMHNWLGENEKGVRVEKSLVWCTYTAKIRDSALGLSGFVSFFWWAYLQGGGLSKENLSLCFMGLSY